MPQSMGLQRVRIYNGEKMVFLISGAAKPKQLYIKE